MKSQASTFLSVSYKTESSDLITIDVTIYNERVEITKLSRLFINYTTAVNARLLWRESK